MSKHLLEPNAEMKQAKIPQFVTHIASYQRISANNQSRKRFDWGLTRFLANLEWNSGFNKQENFSVPVGPALQNPTTSHRLARIYHRKSYVWWSRTLNLGVAFSFSEVRSYQAWCVTWAEASTNSKPAWARRLSHGKSTKSMLKWKKLRCPWDRKIADGSPTSTVVENHQAFFVHVTFCSEIFFEVPCCRSTLVLENWRFSALLP